MRSISKEREAEVRAVTGIKAVRVCPMCSGDGLATDKIERAIFKSCGKCHGRRTVDIVITIEELNTLQYLRGDRAYYLDPTWAYR